MTRQESRREPIRPAPCPRGWRLRWKGGGGPDSAPPGWIDGTVLRPDRLAPLDLEALGAVVITVGSRLRRLGDIFEPEPLVAAATTTTTPPGLAEEPDNLQLVVEGARGLLALGGGGERGHLTVLGPGGELLGAALRGGSILVRGDVGDGAAAGLIGGRVEVLGSAGARLGGPLPGEDLGMRGGEVLVHGDAGLLAGARMRRGLIAIAGEAAEHPGHRMAAGTILVARGPLRSPGHGMRRGSVVAASRAELPPRGFGSSGPVELGWLRLLLRRLTALAFPLTPEVEALLAGRVPAELWSGDPLLGGKGEVVLPF